MEELRCSVREVIPRETIAPTLVLLLITACVRNVAAIALRAGYRSLTHRPTGTESAVRYELPLSHGI